MIIRTIPIILMLPACDAGPQSPAPAAPAALVSGAPMGEPPAPIAEPDTLPDHASPEALLQSVLAGRRERPLAFLARAELPTAGKPRLDSLDEARAHRHFRMNSVQPFWARIEAAVAGGRFRIDVQQAIATARFDVGGAAGVMTLSLQKLDGRWYLDLGN